MKFKEVRYMECKCIARVLIKCDKQGNNWRSPKSQISSVRLIVTSLHDFVFGFETRTQITLERLSRILGVASHVFVNSIVQLRSDFLTNIMDAFLSGTMCNIFVHPNQMRRWRRWKRWKRADGKDETGGSC